MAEEKAMNAIPRKDVLKKWGENEVFPYKQKLKNSSALDALQEILQGVLEVERKDTNYQ
jgi:hypothetical protein